MVPSFKDRWIRFFYLLSEEIYRRAFRVTSLFHNARKTQIDMCCDADKCLVIPNGIQFNRFKDIPLKPDDGWVDDWRCGAPSAHQGRQDHDLCLL